MGMSWKLGSFRKSKFEKPCAFRRLKADFGGDRYYQSSSCAVRSAVICYNIANKFTFDPNFFVKGTNEITLSLPANATDYESAVLPQSVYVQYDALRLEVV
jgi:hypothetical protein